MTSVQRRNVRDLIQQTRKAMRMATATEVVCDTLERLLDREEAASDESLVSYICRLLRTIELNKTDAEAIIATVRSRERLP